MTTPLYQQIHQKLCDWFLQNQRQLPWREPYSPYKTWISEIMLQQTRVDTVVAYFERWMSHYPTIEALAEAEEEQLLKLWEGLGYYSRVRNLHKAALVIQQQFDGTLPREVSELLTLPGIGDYTAAAIASIAYEVSAPIVDGNVQRVFSRLFDWSQEISTTPSKHFFVQTGETLLHFGNPRILNQAIMELGALLCTPTNPQCSRCPVANECMAKITGTLSERPVKKKRAKTIHQAFLVIVYETQGSFYLEQQSAEGLWKNMWLFPMLPLEDPRIKVLPTGFYEKILQRVPPANEKWTPLPAFQHSVTCYRNRVFPLLIQSGSSIAKFPHFAFTNGDPSHRWFSLSELQQQMLPKPSAMIRDFLVDIANQQG